MLVALLVTLPIGGYVAGTLMATTPADQGPLPPVLMRDDVSPADLGPTRSTPRPEPTKAPSPPPAEDDDDDEVRVVRPEPTRVDDDGDDGTDDERADDDGDDRTDDDSDDGGGDD